MRGDSEDTWQTEFVKTVARPKINPSHRCKQASHHQKAEITGGGVFWDFDKTEQLAARYTKRVASKEQSPLEKETVEGFSR